MRFDTFRPFAALRRRATALAAALAGVAIGSGCTGDRSTVTVHGEEQTTRLSLPVTSDGGELTVTRSGPTEVRLGEPFEYEIVVSSNAESVVEGVRLRQETSVGFHILSAREVMEDADADASPEAREGTASASSPPREVAIDEGAWDVGAIAADGSRRFRIRAMADRPGAMSSCVRVEYFPRLCEELSVVEPRLLLETDISTEAQEGTEYICGTAAIDVIYRLKNSGSGKSLPARVRHTLPEGLRTSDGKRIVSFEVDSLAPGGEVEKEVSLEATRGGTFRLEPVVSTDEVEVQSAPLDVRVLRPMLDVRLEGPSSAKVLEPLRYKVVVTNAGEDPALGVEAEVNSLHGARIEQVSSDDGTADLGLIPPGESREFQVVAEVDEPGEVNASLVVRGACLEEITEAVSTNVRGVAALRVEVVDLEDPVRVGETTEYEVRVRNQGSAPDHNVKLRAKLPSQLRFASGEGETELRESEGNIEFATLEALEPDEEVRWRVKAIAASEGQGRFELTVESEATAQPVTEQEPTHVQ